MPAFTFEKISPPARRKPAAPTVNDKPRGAVVQLLDRFSEVRIWRRLNSGKLNAGTPASERREPPQGKA